MPPHLRWIAALAIAGVAAAPVAHAQLRLADGSDRAAFRAWFTFLADAQFYRATDDVRDCAALVRHAYREALRAHSPEWLRLARLPVHPSYPDVRSAPRASDGAWRLFRTAAGAYAEFADAQTLVSQNARLIGRDTHAARPGDLLFFYQPGRQEPHHLMVFIGASAFDASASDFVVYHTGPDGDQPGEVRKVNLADLRRHPSPQWRPVAGNAAFVGVFRLAIL